MTHSSLLCNYCDCACHLASQYLEDTVDVLTLAAIYKALLTEPWTLSFCAMGLSRIYSFKLKGE